MNNKLGEYDLALLNGDKNKRTQYGVFHTPPPLARYVAKSLALLAEKHNMKPDVIFDPACGDGHLLNAAIAAGLANQHPAPRIVGVEILPEVAAVARKNLSGAEIYNANSLLKETWDKINIGNECCIFVIANPPYGLRAGSGKTEKWIKTLVDDYKYIDGEPLGEKNLSNLQDDYVKFIRFAQFKINQAGRGVVGFIVNHTWLDAPTFRGMRWNLMQAFDEIYVLDLHGNSLRKEKTPDGDKDENVFDIRQGVAIVFLVRTGDGKGCKVYHADLWGRRDEKYRALTNNDISTTKWERVNIDTRFYFFMNVAGRGGAKYYEYPSVNDLFQFHAPGVKTGRDKLCVQFSRKEIKVVTSIFAALDPDKAREEFGLGRDTNDWSVDRAQNDLLNSGLKEENIVPIIYRPFDVRYTYYTGIISGFHAGPRSNMARHIIKRENIALCIGRQGRPSNDQYNSCFVASKIIDLNLMIGGSNIFPLYLFNDDGSMSLNLHPRLLTGLRLAYSEPVSPSEVLWYIYAVLYTPLYRERYAGYLRYDFPRIPFPERYEWFDLMATWGKRLVDLHLLRDQSLDSVDIRFEGVGGNRVAKNKGEGFRYDADDQRVYINRTQYFAPVTKEVWEYRIGGYQVAHKWLKDRRGRILSSSDVEAYCKIIKAMEETIWVQWNLDKIFDEVEKQTVDISL